VSSAGWHELQYSVETLSEKIRSISERVSDLQSWLEEGCEDDADVRVPPGEEPAEFPSAAMDSLLSYELSAAREADRLDSCAATSKVSAVSDPLEFARQRLMGLDNRVSFLQAALESLEASTGWIDSFRNVDAYGGAFSEYEARVTQALHGLSTFSEQASEAALSAIKAIRELQGADARRRVEEGKAREDAALRAQREIARRREEEERDAQEQARKEHEARERTPQALAGVLEGHWLVNAVGPAGQTDLQEIRLKRHRFREWEYHAMSRVFGWIAEGRWSALNGSQVRFDACSSPFPGAPPTVPFSDVLTFDVVNRDELQSASRRGIRMDWRRR
jgi:hypothetical protein